MIDLYELHSKPSSLEYWSVARQYVPELIWKDLSNQNFRDLLHQAEVFSTYKKQICLDPTYAFCYTMVSNDPVSIDAEEKMLRYPNLHRCYRNLIAQLDIRPLSLHYPVSVQRDGQLLPDMIGSSLTRKKLW